jgi:hypothetical protein
MTQTRTSRQHVLPWAQQLQLSPSVPTAPAQPPPVGEPDPHWGVAEFVDSVRPACKSREHMDSSWRNVLLVLVLWQPLLMFNLNQKSSCSCAFHFSSLNTSRWEGPCGRFDDHEGHLSAHSPGNQAANGVPLPSDRLLRGTSRRPGVHLESCECWTPLCVHLGDCHQIRILPLQWSNVSSKQTAQRVEGLFARRQGNP